MEKMEEWKREWLEEAKKIEESKREWLEADFPPEEYEKRHAKLRNLMEKKNIDAILLTDQYNLAYFSGFRKATESKHRPRFFLMPLDRDPVFLSGVIIYFTVKAAAWYKDVRPWGGASFFGHPLDPIQYILDIIKELKLEKKVIGMELGHGMAMDLSFLDYERIKNGLPNAEIVDAVDILWECRMIKSPLEIEMIKKAVTLNMKGFKRAFEVARPGMTERELVGEMMKVYIDDGVEGYADCISKTMVLMSSGRERYPLICARPTNRKLKEGDIIFIDGGPYYNGYYSDIHRFISLGEPSAKTKKYMELCRLAHESAYAAVKPGVKVKDVYAAALKPIIDAGYQKGVTIERIGHGMGLDLHERPNVHPNNEMVMEPGMVFTIEVPCIDYPEYETYGSYWEDNLYVTENGVENMSKEIPLELVVTEV